MTKELAGFEFFFIYDEHFYAEIRSLFYRTKQVYKRFKPSFSSFVCKYDLGSVHVD